MWCDQKALTLPCDCTIQRSRNRCERHDQRPHGGGRRQNNLRNPCWRRPSPSPELSPVRSISSLLPTVGSIDSHVGRAGLDHVMVLDVLSLNFLDASEITIIKSSTDLLLRKIVEA